MEESLKTTVEYLKTRTQFGVPIGTFQTLQHRAADMFVRVEQARSMSMFAPWRATSRRQRARHRGGGGESADRQIWKVRRPAVDPAPWRHRHDPGGQDRPLLQAA
jgi:alkylation response protein AidB-like acyl-CoA dehydrogenase